MIGIISVIVILFISLLITRIATIALTHTGLSKESAKFQARSAFTGVGFTTTEAEKVINNPARRKIIMLLMLLGNAGIVTSMASLIIGFSGIEDTVNNWIKVLVLVGGIVILWTLANSKWVDRRMARIINKMLKRFSKLNLMDYAGLLQLAGDYAISEIGIDEDHWLANKKLKDTELTKKGIIILAIIRKDGTFLGTPQANTMIYANNKLIVYGQSSTLYKMEKAHQKPVELDDEEPQTPKKKKKATAPKKAKNL